MCESDQEEEHPLLGQCTRLHSHKTVGFSVSFSPFHSTIHASQCATSFAMHNIINKKNQNTIALDLGA